MAAPQVTITVDAEGHLQVSSNINDAVILIGVLESAKFTVLTRPMQKPSLINASSNGGRFPVP